jgi:hypothetical protein
VSLFQPEKDSCQRVLIVPKDPFCEHRYEVAVTPNKECVFRSLVPGTVYRTVRVRFGMNGEIYFRLIESN